MSRRVRECCFHVKVTGVPHPNLTWYHNGVEVKADYSRDLAEDGSLSLPSSESKHSGVYRLVALNSAGRAERGSQTYPGGRGTE